MDEKKQKVLEHIGRRVKQYRREYGYSREDIAGILGITPRTLAAYERGEREMSVATAVRLAKIFRTTLTGLTDYRHIMGMIK